MLLLFNNLHEKASQKVTSDEILTARVQFVIYNCVTTLHSCYIRMHSFSANQMHITFSCTRTLYTEK